MMKKALSLILLLSLLLIPLFSSVRVTNTVIKLSDPFYDEMDMLFLSMGKTSSKTRPYSSSEARLYLKSIENEPMNSTQKALFSRLVKELSFDADEDFVFAAEGSLKPQIYIHTNKESFRDSITYGLDNMPVPPYTLEYLPFDGDVTWAAERERFMNIGLSLGMKGFTEIHFELPIMNTVHTLRPFGSEYASNNIPMLSSFRSIDYEDFNFNFPYRAYISLGGDWWNVQYGRDQYSFGNGKSGNFIIDGHVPYHNALNASFFNGQIKVDFLVSSFPHPSQYYFQNSDSAAFLSRYFDQNSDAYTGLKLLLDHRIEWITKDRRARLAAEEALMYQSDNGIITLESLNPVMFFHNLYTAGNSNSILSLEWDYILAKGVEQRIAIVVDDLNVPGEKEHDEKILGMTKPDAVGIQIGLKTAHPSGRGFLKTETELTYTSPALYLRNVLKNESGYGYNMNFVIAIRNQRSNHGLFDLTYIGYPYGCDTFNALFNIEYCETGLWNLGFRLDFNAKGINNAVTEYNKARAGTLFSEDSQYFILSSIYGSYDISKHLSLSSSISNISVWNINNDRSRPFAYDFQLVLEADVSF